MWNSRRTASCAVLLGALLLGAAGAQGAGVLAAVTQAAPDMQELLLDVILNGQAVGTTVIVRQGNQLWASEADFARWRLRLPSGPRLTYRGETFASLNSVASSPPQVDERALTLGLEVPVSSFEASVLSLDPAGVDPAPRGFGAFLNYRVGAGYEGTWALDGAADVGVSTPFGVGRSSLFWMLGPDEAQLVRNLTTWTVDVRRGPYSVRLGDNFSQGGAWGVPLLYGGVQWATNFALWPDVPSAPLLTVEGETPVPGVASVYVNGSLVLTRDVPAGPFRITGIPASVTTGIVRVVVRDVTGRVWEVRRPFLSDVSLLRPGLSAFALDAGWLRQDYGVRSFAYGPPFASGVYRRGLTQALTAEVRGEVSPQAFAAGGSLTWAWPQVGTLRATLAGSGGAAGLGGLGALSLYGQQGPWAYGGSVTVRTPAFRQLGAEDALPLQASLGLSRTLGNAGDVSAAYSAQRQSDGSSVSTLAAGYNVTVRNTDLNFGVTQQLTPLTRTTFSVGATAHLGRDTTLSAATSFQGVQVAVSRSAPPGGLGYSASAGVSGGQLVGGGQVSWQGPRGTASVTGTLSPDGSSVSAGVTGAVARLGGEVEFGQQIQEAYALVQVGNFPNVRVYRGGQLVGRTNARGTLLVPSLQPYARNVLSIDPRDLPLSTSVTAAEKTVVPSGGSGTIVVFPVRTERAALLRLVLPGGQPVPLGATVRVDGDAAEYPVISEGQTYVQGLAEKSRLRATWEDGECEAEVTYPSTQDPFVDLGVVKCENT